MSASSVQDFILQSEQNFRVAAAVVAAWPATRVHIANAFLNRLSEKLLSELPGWQSRTWKQFFEDKYSNLHLEKNSWASEYGIILEAGDYGETVVFGVQRDYENAIVAQRPLSQEILDAVRPHFPDVKSKKVWWDAQVPMRNPASDWTSPEVQWRMHADPSFLEAVAEQMLVVARATESIIDRLTQKP